MLVFGHHQFTDNQGELSYYIFMLSNSVKLSYCCNSYEPRIRFFLLEIRLYFDY